MLCRIIVMQMATQKTQSLARPYVLTLFNNCKSSYELSFVAYNKDTSYELGSTVTDQEQRPPLMKNRLIRCKKTPEAKKSPSTVTPSSPPKSLRKSLTTHMSRRPAQ